MKVTSFELDQESMVHIFQLYVWRITTEFGFIEHQVCSSIMLVRERVLMEIQSKKINVWELMDEDGLKSTTKRLFCFKNIKLLMHQCLSSRGQTIY